MKNTLPLLQMGSALYAPADSDLPENCAGFYRVNPVGVTFSDAGDAPHVHIVNSPREGAWPVSCWRDTRGRMHYMHSLADIHVARFGLPSEKPAQALWARSVLDALNAYSFALGALCSAPGTGEQRAAL